MAGRVAEAEKQRQATDRHWSWCGLWKCQSTPSVTQFLQQGHTYPNKAMPPKSLQTVPLPGNQAFKHRRLRRPFSLHHRQTQTEHQQSVLAYGGLVLAF